ncbi:hypothetical protein QL285_030112 [Trifolium repens]|nr:hypothetical protein QL285_089949 [Trifolium repens]KAK2365171.1 hypothetical protein QL285_089953 [Trifolium repens]KAK2431948.1 hypothetical protein QL285_030112 [Trifolium repens]
MIILTYSLLLSRANTSPLINSSLIAACRRCLINQVNMDDLQRQQNLMLYQILLQSFLEMIDLCFTILTIVSHSSMWFYENNCIRQQPVDREGLRGEFLECLINRNDVICVNHLRVDIRSFRILCCLLRNEGKLKEDGLVCIEEQVAIFLHIIAHHTKNRVIKLLFKRSGETVSRYFNLVLNAILRLHEVLLKAPEPVLEDCLDERWKLFKNCLGALDGTHIQVNVPAIDKPRYRNRKGDISTNVLGVCSRDMQFIYVMPGWEGSASDSRVLRDAISRTNGLKVPTGYYYLVDAGYTNSEGFLAPYRGCRYHRSEWRQGYTPSNKKELFNMKHSMARNVIERTFGLLKMRWAILRSRSFYPIKIQIRIINACCLLHNFIRREMPTDPMEEQLGINMEAQLHNEDIAHAAPINTIEGSDAWSTWRENLATGSWNEWLARHMN